MDTSIFFARFLGLYLVIIGLAFLLQRGRLEAVVRELFLSPTWMLFSGALSVMFGLVIIVLHNHWVPSWIVIITIIGWIALIKGLLRLFLPDHLQPLARVVTQPQTHLIISIVTILVGVILIYFGFIHYA